MSLGAISYVYRLNDHIIIKYARDVKSGELERENAIYDIMERHTASPYLMQSFFRTSVANFLPYMMGGTLDQRLRSNQIFKTPAEGETRQPKMVGVRKLEPRPLVERWTAELAAAAAWLESLEYAHTDLRPPNILLDSNGHLKVTDFDQAKPFGEPSDGNAAPWARLQSTKAGDDSNGWGDYGPRTEQFTIGSIVYYLTRGVEPYDEKGTEATDLFRAKVFPILAKKQDALDEIIYKCWWGSYLRLSDLAAEAASLQGAEDMKTANVFDSAYVAARREECRQLVDGGLLDPDDK